MPFVRMSSARSSPHNRQFAAPTLDVGLGLALDWNCALGVSGIAAPTDLRLESWDRRARCWAPLDVARILLHD